MTVVGRSDGVRPPALAGTWYPGRRQDLEATIDRFLGGVTPAALPGDLVALIAPHAGYVYSGQVAAHAHAQLKGKAFGTVVLIGPAHRAAIGAFATPAYAALRSPLGEIAVDHGLVTALAERVHLERITLEEDGGENSLEIQLPFLQRTLAGFKLLPIMMGYPLAERFRREGWAACHELSVALVEVLAGHEDVLMVASTDLSHLSPYSEVVRHDRVFTALMEEFDAERLARALMAGECHACGGSAVATVMLAAQARGADRATVLAYANSGDVTGERIGRPYIVGYTAVAITRAARS